MGLLNRIEKEHKNFFASNTKMLKALKLLNKHNEKSLLNNIVITMPLEDYLTIVRKGYYKEEIRKGRDRRKNDRRVE